jgi:hypothetical protein
LIYRYKAMQERPDDQEPKAVQKAIGKRRKN